MNVCVLNFFYIRCQRFCLQIMSVGGYISELSRDRGLSQSDVARECGFSRQIMSYIIAGERKMTIQQALRLESLFSLKSGTLLKMQEESI